MTRAEPSPADPTPRPVAPRKGASRSLVTLMALAVLAVASLSYWDARRESAEALNDFEAEQVALAQATADELGARIALARARGPEGKAPSLLALLTAEAASLDRPGERKVVVLPPGTTAASVGPAEAPLALALSMRQRGARLSRAEALSLGLPERTAVAGLSTLEADGGERWGVAVVASAHRVRDRETRAAWRVVLSVLTAGGLVVGFGAAALRRQRQELELWHELELEALRRKRDERLVRASRLATMGTMASGVAHEISTPLGVIAGRAEQLLPRVGDDERAKKAVQVILDQTGRIKEVVRGFLDLARGAEPDVGELSPAEVARRASALVEHRFEQAGVALSLEIAEPLPNVQGDARLLEHALVNLLLNACQACERGGQVTLLASRQGGEASLSVEDDGVGINAEAVARATEPFFTTKAAGTGLGLAITHEIVKMHRGSLTLEPRSPRGTRATIALPAATA